MAKATTLTVEDLNIARANAAEKTAEWERAVSFGVKRYGKEWKAMIYANWKVGDTYMKVYGERFRKVIP